MANMQEQAKREDVENEQQDKARGTHKRNPFTGKTLKDFRGP